MTEIRYQGADYGNTDPEPIGLAVSGLFLGQNRKQLQQQISALEELIDGFSTPQGIAYTGDIEALAIVVGCSQEPLSAQTTAQLRAELFQQEFHAHLFIESSGLSNKLWESVAPARIAQNSAKFSAWLGVELTAAHRAGNQKRYDFLLDIRSPERAIAHAAEAVKSYGDRVLSAYPRLSTIFDALLIRPFEPYLATLSISATPDGIPFDRDYQILCNAPDERPEYLRAHLHKETLDALLGIDGTQTFETNRHH